MCNYSDSIFKKGEMAKIFELAVRYMRESGASPEEAAAHFFLNDEEKEFLFQKLAEKGLLKA